MDQRLIRLIPGLILFGVGMGMAVDATLGVSPWTVFHGGVADLAGLTIGTVVVITGAAILLLFRPLNEPLGLGTLGNTLLIGPALDITRAIIPDTESLWLRWPLLLAAPVVIGLASGLYIGSGLGPGPRDGMMTALSRRGVATWKARTGIEFLALSIGWLLGGDVGFGTVYMAIAVGPAVQFFLPHLRIDSPEGELVVPSRPDDG